jgi:hypothetical protein
MRFLTNVGKHINRLHAKFIPQYGLGIPNDLEIEGEIIDN